MSWINKENITLTLVIALFVWRIIDAIIKKIDKKNLEREKLAFNMAKIKADANSYNKGNILSYYFNSLEALEKKIRNPEGFLSWCAQKEADMTIKIDELEFKYNNLANIHSDINQAKKINPELFPEREINLKSIVKDIGVWYLGKNKKKK